MIRLNNELAGQRYLYIVTPMGDTENQVELDDIGQKMVFKLDQHFGSQESEIGILHNRVNQLIVQNNKMRDEFNAFQAKIEQIAQKMGRRP